MRQRLHPMTLPRKEATRARGMANLRFFTFDLEKLTVNKALEDVFTVIKRANKYIDETSPWVLARDESKKGRLMRVMYNDSI